MVGAEKMNSGSGNFTGLEAEIARLRKNNDSLTENNRILAHAIQDDRTKTEKVPDG